MGRWGIGRVILRGLKNKDNLLSFKELLKALVYETNVAKLNQSVEDFARKKIKDVTVGTISPILYCLQPTLYPVLNHKTYSFFDILSSNKHTNNLRDYTAMAKVVREFRNHYGLQTNLCFFDYMGVDYSDGEREFSHLLKQEIRKFRPGKTLKEVTEIKIPNIHKGKKYIKISLEKKEQSNRRHQELCALLHLHLRSYGYKTMKNQMIDLAATINKTVYLFEVKSSRKENIMNQMRLAIGQLFQYEYIHFRAKKVIKCIVFANKPNDFWIEFLEKRMNILVLWIENNDEFNGGPKSRNELKFLLE